MPFSVVEKIFDYCSLLISCEVSSGYGVNSKSFGEQEVQEKIHERNGYRIHRSYYFQK